MGELVLEIRDYRGPTRWRWILKGPGEKRLADYNVVLDERCWQYEAFTDLWSYLSWNVAPDRRMKAEARIVDQVGEWIGEHIFGPLGPALCEAAPVTVRVCFPQEAVPLMFWPLELAHVNGKPLALQDVILIMQHAFEDEYSDADLSDRLRVLGLFSLPTGEKPLNLRRERRAFVDLFTQIDAVGRTVNVHALQYGVSRERLQDVLAEGGGWDIIHISGHGAPGELTLEADDGSPDPVSGRDLGSLLVRAQPKLVTFFTCWSAAATTAAQRKVLGLPAAEIAGEKNDAAHRNNATSGALATNLAELGCAVLAMRYPINDDFAIAFGGRLYDMLADKGQPLPRAVGISLRETMARRSARTLLSATPALFGSCAAPCAWPHRYQ